MYCLIATISSPVLIMMDIFKTNVLCIYQDKIQRNLSTLLLQQMMIIMTAQRSGVFRKNKNKN